MKKCSIFYLSFIFILGVVSHPVSGTNIQSHEPEIAYGDVEKPASILKAITQNIINSDMVASADASESDKPPGLAIDGDMNTRWAAPSKATVEQPHYFVLDMARDYVLNRIGIHWFNSSNNNRAYKYLVQLQASAGDNYETAVDRSSNTTTDYVEDDINNKAGRYLKIYVEGSTSSSIYSFPSIWELHLDGWSVSSTVYEVDLAQKTIIVSTNASSISDSEFLSNLSFFGNQTHSLSSGTIVSGSTLTIIDSGNTSFSFTITLKSTNAIENVETDKLTNSVPVYYNLQGIQVQKPTKGIYIKKTGKKIEKVVFSGR
ncbi:MAG: discoidin domain-containing protein [Dysgonamonadaceae bacterium]